MPHRFSDTARPAYARQFFLGPDSVVDQADQSGLVYIIRLQHFCKSTISLIKSNPHFAVLSCLFMMQMRQMVAIFKVLFRQHPLILFSQLSKYKKVYCLAADIYLRAGIASNCMEILALMMITSECPQKTFT